jgi:hypothetical protein
LLGTVDFSGLGNRVPVDPDVVELPDGSLRIYFLDFSTAGGQAGMHEICSAVSTDGIHFTVEAGIRLSSASIFDPDIIRLSGGTYRMYLNAGDVVSASGSDGLIFTMDQGKRVERGGIPGAIVLPDGRVWLYCSGNGIALYESSDNGTSFVLKKDSVIPTPLQGGIVADPSVAAMPSGGYLMVYKYQPPSTK